MNYLLNVRFRSIGPPPLIRMVQDMLTSIENKAITDTPLTEKEKQFINSTSIPILSWIVDQSSLSISQSLFAQLTDYIAVDVYPDGAGEH